MVFTVYYVFLVMFAVASGVGMVSVPYKKERFNASYIVGLIILFLISVLALIASGYYAVGFALIRGFEGTLFCPVSMEIAFIISIIIASVKIVKEQSVDEKVSVGLLILSFFVPLAGIIIGIVYLCSKKRTGGIYLSESVLSSIVQLIITFAMCIWIFEIIQNPAL